MQVLFKKFLHGCRLDKDWLLLLRLLVLDALIPLGVGGSEDGAVDLYFSSPSFSISENWALIFADEFPCRALPIRF